MVDAPDTVVAKPGRPDPLIGREIQGRWRVVRKIGQGGMGTVYLAEQLSIQGRPVALKFLHPVYADDDGLVARFRREAERAASIRHPGVVTVHDLGETEDGRLFIAMEYVEGSTLRDLIKEGGLGVPRVLRLGGKIAEALAAAHEVGVLHRDVKPANVIVRPGGDDIVLMDFGVARLADGAATIAHHTQTGVVLGTPGYMAPEQAQGAEVTELTDVYSFGVVLYEMLTGDIPFRGTTPAATLVKLLREQPEPVRTLRPDVPPAVERLVMQVLEKDPAGRPASMAELAKKLRAVADTMGPSARDRAKTRSRRGLGMVAAGAGLLVAAGITWLFARGEFQNPPVTRPADEAPEPVVDVPVTAPVDTAAADRAQYDDHLRVGEFFFDRGNYLDAAAEFEAALAIDPDGARAKELLARTQRAKSAEERILRGG